MVRFLKPSSALAFTKGLLNGRRCHTTRALRAHHFGSGAQEKI